MEERLEELLSGLQDEANNLSNMRIQYYRPLTAFHHFFAHITIFIKKIIRKCLRFLIEPIVSETEQYRIIMDRTTKKLIEIVEIQNVILQELEREISER